MEKSKIWILYFNMHAHVEIMYITLFVSLKYETMTFLICQFKFIKFHVDVGDSRKFSIYESKFSLFI